METKGLIHVSAPDHPEAGASKPSLGEGSGCYAGGPGPYEGSGTLRGSGLLGRSGAPAACACVPVSPGTRGIPGPSPAVERVRTIVGRTGLRTAGVRLFGCSQG